jgi:hypothetical protein
LLDKQLQLVEDAFDLRKVVALLQLMQEKTLIPWMM